MSAFHYGASQEIHLPGAVRALVFGTEGACVACLAVTFAPASEVCDGADDRSLSDAVPGEHVAEDSASPVCVLLPGVPVEGGGAPSRSSCKVHRLAMARPPAVAGAEALCVATDCWRWAYAWRTREEGGGRGLTSSRGAAGCLTLVPLPLLVAVVAVVALPP